MNPSSDIATPPMVETPDPDRPSNATLPANWRQALVALLASRAALIELESKEAAKAAAQRALRMVAALACACFTWALLLAGGTALLAHATGWPWYGITLGAGALHLGAACWLTRTTQAPAPPAFPVTRAEFQKDREWIENLQKTPKSNA